MNEVMFGRPSAEVARKHIKISIVTVTYNNESTVERLVRSIAEDGGVHEVIIVDNDSSDQTVERLEALGDSRVKVIVNPENFGFARACNIGAAQATGDVLLFLNPDTWLLPNALDNALGYLMSHDDVGVVGGHTLFEDMSTNRTCCFAEPSLQSGFLYATGLSSIARRSKLLNPEALGNWDRNENRTVDVVTGCFLMMERDLFADLNGFDERFFIYSEDTDLCTRVRQKGYRCVHVGSARLVHIGGGSEPDRADKITKVFIGKSKYYIKHWSRLRALIGCRLLDISAGFRMVALTVVRKKKLADRWTQVWNRRKSWDPGKPGVAKISDELPTGGHLVPIRQTALINRARIVYQTCRHVARSLRRGWIDFALQGVLGLLLVPVQTLCDVIGIRRRKCNVCGWKGAWFYPNAGPGYFELDCLCPGCMSQDRHRSLLVLLGLHTPIFHEDVKVVEVAPMRGFEALLRQQTNIDYTSFDLERRAMESGDITRMRFKSGSVDIFICFHVLEHLPDDWAALTEIHRVLSENGCAFIQVPIDWTESTTVEYETPDLRDVGHVRRYGRDFGSRLSSAGFSVRTVDVSKSIAPAVVKKYGLSIEPVYIIERMA